MVIAGGIEGSQETKPLSLEVIIAKTVRALLRIHHLNRDVVIGLIGDRGSGKSVGAGGISVVDWGIEGDVIRSNMNISCDIAVSEETASLYGVEPGSVHYQSEELDKHKFLTFSPDYFRSVFVIDEINLWLADARRTMSNQNLLADDVVQQLRKWESPLIYTCIHEMMVDSRIRDGTDLFIKTSDTALTPNGLRNKQRQGITFEWLLYLMTRKFTGNTYSENKKAVGPIPINGRMFWDIINTNQAQERKKYKPEGEDEESPVRIGEDGVVVNLRSKWGWLVQNLINLHNDGVQEIQSTVLWEFLQLDEREISSLDVGKQLTAMAVGKRWSSGKLFYQINNFDLSKGISVASVKELLVSS